MTIPDFGIDRVAWHDTFLECRRIAPGLTFQDFSNAYHEATKDCTPADLLAGNPMKWPTPRGLKAVIDLMLGAVYADDAPLRSDLTAANAEITRLNSLLATHAEDARIMASYIQGQTPDRNTQTSNEVEAAEAKVREVVTRTLAAKETPDGP